MLGLYDGATKLIERAHTRTDGVNLTNVWDNVDTANTASYWYTPANRLQNADGAWGTRVTYYDGVGNRVEDRQTPAGGAQTIDTYSYPAGSNRLVEIIRGTQTFRSLGYDGAGNLTSDSQLGSARTFTYNAANRLKTASFEGNLKGTYTYNGHHQLIRRVVSNTAGANGATVYVHDRSGNVIAEVDASGNTAREYIWLPEAGYAGTDLPIAVVDGVATSPVVHYVHTDHISRPIRMTDAAKVAIWTAEWNPWGTPVASSGGPMPDLRFPGQWFNIETGLHYNWHRHYDPSVGRYTQPDPLGFVDGPSVYGYAKGSPIRLVDPAGQNSITVGGNIGQGIGTLTPLPGGALIGRGLGMLAGAAIMCMSPSTDEAERCKRVLKRCKSKCSEIYADDPESLPGSGRNYQPRIQRCINECAAAEGCGNEQP